MKQTLTKKQIKIRIDTLNQWLKLHPDNPMHGTVKKESNLYRLLLLELEAKQVTAITNSVHTSIYQQIGHTL